MHISSHLHTAMCFNENKFIHIVVFCVKNNFLTKHILPRTHVIHYFSIVGLYPFPFFMCVC